MDIVPIQKLLSEEDPTYIARTDPDVKFSYTSLHDLGDAAARILEQREEHFWATYQMVSTSPPMGYREVCELASKMMGKEITVEMMPFQKTMEGEGKAEGLLGLPPGEHERDGIQRMLLYYEYRGLVASTNVMKWVLGREPNNWDDWIRGKMRETEGR